MPEMVHPVTGAAASVSDENLKWYEDNGWVDNTPYEFKDNSWSSVNPQAAAEQEQARANEQEQAQADSGPGPEPTLVSSPYTTAAADPDAAGVKGEG